MNGSAHVNKLKGLLSLLSCAVILGLFGILVRVLSRELQAYQQILFRNALGLLIALVAVALSRQSFSSLKAAAPALVALYALAFPISVVFFTLAVLRTTIITTIFALYTGSLLTSLLIGRLAFKEPMSRTKGLSLLMVLIGLVAYAYPFEQPPWSAGFVLGLLSGGFDATTNGLRKHLGRRVQRFVLVSLQMVGGVAVALPLMCASSQLMLPQLSAASWAVGLLFGGGLVAMSYLTLVGFQNFDLNLGTIVLSSEIFFATLFAFLFYGESATLPQLLGSCLIVMATALVT